MSNFQISKEDLVCINYGQDSHSSLTIEQFNSFNESILGINKIDLPTIKKEAICIIFDLEGFTSFCFKPSSLPIITNFLNDFLRWIFLMVRLKNIQKRNDKYIALFSSFPFFNKFMGDGVMFIYDTEIIDVPGIHNIIVQMKEICDEYHTLFYSQYSSIYQDMPKQLRCGIARGPVFSIGGGQDYVGPCINKASRLQKLDEFSFSFSLEGIDISKVGRNPEKYYTSIRSTLRGAEREERIGVLLTEFNSLSQEAKKEYK